MANDPAFLFYPGDYLRDTQCLSEKPQVAYDRIMCEHMRNITITQERLEFFTKRLSADEKDELTHVLTKVDGGFMITWVAESISKRRGYSASRRQNRQGKSKKHISNTSSTYVNHMENEIVIEDETVIPKGGAGETPAAPIPPPSEQSIVGELATSWKKAKPDYPLDNQTDGRALFDIGEFLTKQLQGKWPPETDVGRLALLETWDRLARWIAADDFYKSWALAQIARTKNLQTIWQKSREVKNGAIATKSGRSGNRKAQGTDELIEIIEGDLRAYGAGSEGP